MARTTLLIVDDDLDTCDALAEWLREEGFEASCVGSPRAALDDLVRKPAPEMILLDMQFPGPMDGWGFLRAKAATPAIAAIPAVVITADSSVPDSIDGVVAVVRKPFDLPGLLMTLRAPRR